MLDPMELVERLRRFPGIVRVRQILDQLQHRLSFIPGLYVIGGIIASQTIVLVDRSMDEVPQYLATTVESARAVFSVIAGGLITSITLLLSMMLITVQLASSQFSPRTLRDWLGDSYLKHTIGIALGTTVFSLLALRSTRSLDDGGAAVVPHLALVVAVALTVISLFAVVRSVDHITQSLRVGSVARRIADDTIAVIERAERVNAGQDPQQAPSGGRPDAIDGDEAVPANAAPIEAPASGWIQQVRAASIVEALPEHATGHVVVPLGAFVPAGTPLMWVSPAPGADDESRSRLLEAFAMGDTRTLQQDVGFGLVQLTDIAVRALSPGINDPSTANDLIVHLGDVLLALWAQPTAPMRLERDGRTLIRSEPDHADHLHSAMDAIRRHGASDPSVTSTLVRTLQQVRSEAHPARSAGPDRATRGLDRRHDRVRRHLRLGTA